MTEAAPFDPLDAAPGDPLDEARARLRADALADEAALVRALADDAALSGEDRARISQAAADLVRAIRSDARPGLMERFLEEYGLSSEEGVALMCLAEALLRVPDAETMDELIEDKIAPSQWGRHLGRSASSLVNASTWGLMLTGRVLREDETSGLAATLHGLVRRLGEPVIRTAVHHAMREMGRQFVLGRDIEEAARNARPREEAGYAYSYDMLGEAARTDADARRYHAAYAGAIASLAKRCEGGDIRDNPGISVKFSALHPRYETAHRQEVMDTLVPRARDLARAAREAGMGFNIDAEEAERLELSLDVIEAILSDPYLAGWDGFGVVVQAYGKRAPAVLDWLHAMAERLDRRLMVRLVKGAYWDTEIKRAQVLGLPGFPVFTRKAATDVSFLACARKLLAMRERIYPQFATHNAHTAMAVLDMAGPDRAGFEFQRLHGMGEALHEALREREGTRCRIYAPVGAHRDLLAYLVRRLLENGANSSFVHQIVDEDVPPETVAADPLSALEGAELPNPAITPPPALYAPERRNSRGWDLADPAELAEIERARAPFRSHVWRAAPILAAPATGDGRREALDPADLDDAHPAITEADAADIEAALSAARPWTVPAEERAAVLERAADLYEEHYGELFAVAAREAGKNLLDGVGELREAVDFLRYYAARGREAPQAEPRGVITCISPWNFPLAIFTGQISAALAAGNAVLAKPAEQTPLIAHRAVELLHEAGVPHEALQFLPGEGGRVGAALTSDPRVNGVVFTGSTDTAQAIHRAMADNLSPEAPLIAETGGLNAMIVDSTALPEQAVRDILASAFQSAGQRCSALRCLYVQEDVAEEMLKMLFGAMDALTVGDPWPVSTDVGPVIDPEAKAEIDAHVRRAKEEGRLLKQLPAPKQGCFVGPAAIRVDGIEDLDREIFGPVLHIATYRAEDLHRVIETVNRKGYGLTFGLHTRIDNRVQEVVDRVRVGNLYVNRNQIGAIVGSQPFGGEGMSGTGPKAGGPAYVPRFRAAPLGEAGGAGNAEPADAGALAEALSKAPEPDPRRLEATELPGPTGESNRLSLWPRGRVFCLGPGAEAATEQARQARAAGCVPVELLQGASPEALEQAPPFAAAVWWGDKETARALRRALAARSGPILPLVREADLAPWLVVERHVCVDTTAAGGNAALLAASEG
ncbi:MAG: bifunctional proline dehydrogenase/L-glutamate gamma-semialdehyde dehydrogenase PutA [Pseudomonadota bacterium]